MNIAGIGLGGRGTGLLTALGSQNIVAVCDPDDRHLATATKKWPAAKRHRDFRRMLDTQKDIDAVVVATPDHLHFVASMWAIKSGKHVYCEKPLTRTIGEARCLPKPRGSRKLPLRWAIRGMPMKASG